MAKEMKVLITDPVGLYATPATELVKAIKIFNCRVDLHYEDKVVNMKSMMGVLSLGIPSKAVISIVVEGPDEEPATDAIKKEIVSMNIGEIL
ncbi:MAG: HPr family phosphocarrier protein [Faecalibacillus sp.]